MIRLGAILFGTAAAVMMAGMMVSTPGVSRASVPRWADRLVPSDARLVGVVDFDKLAQSELNRSVARQIQKHGAWQALGVCIDPADVAELVFFAVDYRRPVLLVRTYRDMSLDRVVRPADKIEPVAYDNVVCVSTGPLWAARLGSRRFCVARSQADLEAEIDHCARRESLILRDELSQLFDEIKRADHYLAAVQLPGAAASSISGLRLGFSLDANLEINLVLWCRNDSEARNQRTRIQAALKDVGSLLAGLPSPLQQSVADLAKAADVTDEEQLLRIGAKWSIDDLKTLADRAAAVDLSHAWETVAGSAPSAEKSPDATAAPSSK